MTFHHSMQTLIQKRFSCRTYQPRPLEEAHKEQLTYFMQQQASGPSGHVYRFMLVNSGEAAKEGVKLGTYGIIRGASDFIIGVLDAGSPSLEEYGYAFEKVILYATSLGLGTCWLGGTFSRSSFAQQASLGTGESIPIVSPVGYKKEKPSLVESAMRIAARSNQRKEWNELFFDTSFAHSLPETAAGDYQKPLEMVRRGPSASNKQPWRIVRAADAYHFYLQHAPGYAKAPAIDIQRIDMGIAMCHFELTARELQLEGRWSKEKPADIHPPKDCEYIVTWKA